MQLWILYAKISIELRKKSELAKESAVNACRVYRPYIADILCQVEEVIKLFSMEKELRKIRNRGECNVFICPVARIGSGDPVRVLCLYTTITLDEVCSIYC